MDTKPTRKKRHKEQEPELEDLIDASTDASEDVKKALEGLSGGNTSEEPRSAQEEAFEEQQGPYNETFVTENVSEDEMKEEEDPTANLQAFLPVRVDSIPITDEDKTLYLKALLNDAPVVLDVKMENGFRFKLRSLSSYEEQVVTAASIWNLKDHAEMSLAEGLGMGAVHQYRVSMQLVEINGNPVEHKRFRFEHGVSSMERDACELRNFSDSKLMNTQGVLYGLYLKALEIFLRKLNKLQEASLSLNFWPPEGGA